MRDLEGVKIWTDGSVASNPGPGGWAWLRIYQVEGNGLAEKLGWGYVVEQTTNQRMEIMAVCAALEQVPTRSDVVLYSDSAYIVNCIQQQWYYSWRRRDWRTAAGKPVANRDLWERMLKAISEHEHVEFCHVRGHQENEQNNMVHELAFRQAQKAKRLIP